MYLTTHCWHIVLERSTVWHESEEIPTEASVREARYVVPENHLEAEVEDIEKLEVRVMNIENNQNVLYR